MQSGMRMATRALRSVLAGLMLLGGVGFAVAAVAVPFTVILGISLQGSAWAGYARDGAYFVVAKGEVHQVSARAFGLMLGSEWAAVVSGVLLLLGLAAWAANIWLKR